MKKIAFISGTLGVILVLLGFTGGFMHWEYNGSITATGTMIIAFVFIPSVAKYFYDNTKTD